MLSDLTIPYIKDKEGLSCHMVQNGIMLYDSVHLVSRKE